MADTGITEEPQINIDHYVSKSYNGKTFLNLCDQKLTEIPSAVFDREDVTNLFLSNNSICAIPPEITKLKQLEVLVLDNNCLESIPVELCDLKK